MSSFQDQLRALDACEEAREWVGDKTLTEAWQTCHRSDWMLWLIRQTNALSDSELRLLACAFVRHTPLGDGRTVWNLLTDERSRRAVEVAEAFANGSATEQELEAARDAAWAAWAAARAAAWAAAWTAARDAAWAAARAAAWAARDARDAAWAAAWTAARDAAWAWQSDYIRQTVPLERIEAALAGKGGAQ